MGAEFKFKFEFETELITKNKSENERLTFIDGWSNSLVNSKFSNRYSVHCAKCICKDKGN